MYERLGLYCIVCDLSNKTEQLPIASSDWSSLGCLAQVIGNLLKVSQPVLISRQAIGGYWSILAIPITNDWPIKSILGIHLMVVFNLNLTVFFIKKASLNHGNQSKTQKKSVSNQHKH